MKVHGDRPFSSGCRPRAASPRMKPEDVSPHDNSRAAANCSPRSQNPKENPMSIKSSVTGIGVCRDGPSPFAIRRRCRARPSRLEAVRQTTSATAIIHAMALTNVKNCKQHEVWQEHPRRLHRRTTARRHRTGRARTGRRPSASSRHWGADLAPRHLCSPTEVALREHC